MRRRWRRLKATTTRVPSHPVTAAGGDARRSLPVSEDAVRAGIGLRGGTAGAGAADRAASSDDTMQRGLKGEYFANVDLQRKPALTRVDHADRFRLEPRASPAPGVPRKTLACAGAGRFQPPEPGDYPFSIDLRGLLSVRGRRCLSACISTGSRSGQRFERDESYDRANARRRSRCTSPTRSRMRSAWSTRIMPAVRCGHHAGVEATCGCNC